MLRICFATLLACGLCLVAQFSAAEEYDPFIEVIRQAKLDVTSDALAEYLHTLVPSEENKRRANELLAQLGDAEFRVREAAEAALANLASPPIEKLREATTADDAEVRFRAKRVLVRIEQGESHRLPSAVLGYIAHHKLKGLAAPLVELWPHWNGKSGDDSLRRALVATAQASDAELLRKLFASEKPELRAVAAQALAAALGEKAGDELARLLSDTDANVQLVAAEALANLGDRRALATLVELLAADDLNVRTKAHGLLKAFTHEDIAFVPYDSPEARSAAIGKWEAWRREHGESAELHFPLAPQALFLGRTLMSQWPNTLKEVDASGKEQFKKDGFQYVWGCHGLPNGHRVVSDFSSRLVIEFDANGKEIWRKEGLPGPPSDVQKLDNGNFLFALSDSQILIEINPAGEETWKISLEGRPTTAQRLANGNTLVNLQFGKRVVEVNPAGKVVWELKGLSNALTAQALPNGNVLVCEMDQGKAVEYDRSGRKVWEKEGYHNACQAQRVPNGNTLISDSQGLHEVDPSGKEVWHLKVPRGRFWRY